MEEPELNYIKVPSNHTIKIQFQKMLTDFFFFLQMINAGERIDVNNCYLGYLSHRIVFYLLNLHIKTRHTYFARVSSLAIELELLLIKCNCTGG